MTACYIPKKPLYLQSLMPNNQTGPNYVSSFASSLYKSSCYLHVVTPSQKSHTKGQETVDKSICFGKSYLFRQIIQEN